MSDSRLAAIQARLAAATPGPWTAAVDALIESPFGDVGGMDRYVDAVLAAHAPADLAYLLAELARLRAGLREYGGHRRDLRRRCSYWLEAMDADCDCGLIDLLDGNPPGTMQAALADDGEAREA